MIPAQCRFQVDLVPAHSVLWLFLQDDLHAPVDPIYNDALMREIDRLAAAIPHRSSRSSSTSPLRCSRGCSATKPNAYGRDRDAMLASFGAILVKLANHVPADVELMFHFCYGDSNHKHVVEPIDMGDMVDVANLLCAGIKRPVDLIHMPVPRDRDDDGYFAPLARLRLQPGTELCLGLVHYTDGAAGTRRRLATAEKHVQNFSIATECGFGRRAPDTIPELLRIHAEVAG